jgi:hypothetical protein
MITLLIQRKFTTQKELSVNVNKEVNNGLVIQ